MPSTTHECPAPGCRRQVPFDKLGCSQHWYMLPREMRNRLWKAWRDGPVGEHAKVRAECVRWLKENVAA